MCPEHAEGMANIVDPDQTAASEVKEQSELGLQCLLIPFRHKT